MWEIRLKPLYSSDPVGLQEPFRDKRAWCSFPPPFILLTEFLGFSLLYLVPKIICKCRAAILFSRALCFYPGSVMGWIFSVHLYVFILAYRCPLLPLSWLSVLRDEIKPWPLARNLFLALSILIQGALQPISHTKVSYLSWDGLLNLWKQVCDMSSDSLEQAF